MRNEHLKEVIKESFREVINEERLNLCEIMVPFVSDKELDEIHEKFGSPNDYDERTFEDMTAWVKNEN